MSAPSMPHTAELIARARAAGFTTLYDYVGHLEAIRDEVIAIDESASKHADFFIRNWVGLPAVGWHRLVEMAKGRTPSVAAYVEHSEHLEAMRDEVVALLRSRAASEHLIQWEVYFAAQRALGNWGMPDDVVTPGTTEVVVQTATTLKDETWST